MSDPPAELDEQNRAALLRFAEFQSKKLEAADDATLMMNQHRAPREGQPGSVRFVELTDGEALEVAKALAELAKR
jgi:hypothetical protein